MLFTSSSSKFFVVRCYLCVCDENGVIMWKCVDVGGLMVYEMMILVLYGEGEDDATATSELNVLINGIFKSGDICKYVCVEMLLMFWDVVWDWISV